MFQEFINEVIAATAAGRTGSDTQFQMYLEAQGYSEVRKLDDGTWIALVPLIFTTGVCMKIDRWGYDRRYCYEDHGLALAEIRKLKSGTDIPQGWIAKRVR